MTKEFFDDAAKDVAATDYENNIDWKPEVGDVLQGTLVSARVTGTARGDYPIILTIDEHGTDNVYTVWVGSSPFHLEKEVMDAAPMVGKLIYLTLVETKQPKDPNKNPYKIFAVRSEDADFDFWLKLKQKQQYQENDPGPSSQAGDGSHHVVKTNIGPDDAPF
jgi:hypothetical protein